MLDFVSPGDDVIMLMGIPFFEVFQETLYQLASGGEDGQSDHNEKDPLEDRQKEAKNPKTDQYPANDPESYLFIFVHNWGSLTAVL
jgi:hypothetical protein